MTQPSVIVINQKSIVLALILTFFFGPFGMLYSTIIGGIIMLILTGLVGFFTAGIGLFFMWPVQMLWAALAANNHNKAQMSSARRVVNRAR